MYGEDINPQRTNKILRGIKAERQHVTLTHNPSTISPGQRLLIRFPNLGSDVVIVPGSFYISCLLTLTGSKDKGRTVVNNVGRKIIKTLKIRFEGNEVLSIDNYDEYMTYKDLWLTKKEVKDRIFQGIQSDDGLKLRVSSENATGTAEETAINTTLGNRFRIPIEFELLNDIGPYYQSGLGDKLEIELTFNEITAVVKASNTTKAIAVDADYGYTVSDIRTEWDQITHPHLASSMDSQYSLLALPFTRVLHHQMRSFNKSDSVLNLNINIPAKSLTHILLLTIDPDDRKKYQHTETFKNLDITKLSVTIEGSPNKLYSSGLTKEHTWAQIRKLFPNTNNVSLGAFLTTKYALCLDLRPSIDTTIHGGGVRLENTAEGLTLELHRTGAGTGKLQMHIFLLQDAQLNIQGGRFHSVEY